MGYQMIAAPSGDLLSASHASLCWWRVPYSWCWCWIYSISPRSSRTRWSLPAPSQTYTHTAQQSRLTGIRRDQARLLRASLFSQSTPLLFFFFFFSVEALFYNCEWEVSRLFHIVWPYYRAARTDTPKARNLFQISYIFILPCPIRRPRDYR